MNIDDIRLPRKAENFISYQTILCLLVLRLSTTVLSIAINAAEKSLAFCRRLARTSPKRHLVHLINSHYQRLSLHNVCVKHTNTCKDTNTHTTGRQPPLTLPPPLFYLIVDTRAHIYICILVHTMYISDSCAESCRFANRSAFAARRKKNRLYEIKLPNGSRVLMKPTATVRIEAIQGRGQRWGGGEVATAKHTQREVSRAPNNSNEHILRLVRPCLRGSKMVKDRG